MNAYARSVDLQSSEQMGGGIRGLLVGIMLNAMAFTAAGAPPSGARPAAGEMRSAYAGAIEVAEGKRVAAASCAQCHGMSGISTTKAVPHLAGQRAPYVYVELKAYQSGERLDKGMQAAVKFLSDDALVNVAAYYASLDVPVPAAAPAASKAAPKTDAVSAGKAAAAGCSGCHGDGGNTRTPGMPNLVGLDTQYLVAAMNAYRSGARKHDMMKSLLSGLSDSDRDNIALYYALQKPARAQTPAAGDPAAGKAAAAACSSCHGAQGTSAGAPNPSLAGQDAQYLVAALQAYKDGSRNDATMKGLAAALDERAMRNLAAFYAAQQPQAPNVRKPLTTAEWAGRCDRCHGVNGNSTDPKIPALAAQRADYLEKVLHAYRTGARRSAAMAAMTHLLSESDIENLATHYARQNARAVVYVPLPAK
ncbi:MAG TPA: c-type cytochrome [Burkholderiales bacterium]|nr:c-type cytochrome [Burkholderiales bacterium]